MAVRPAPRTAKAGASLRMPAFWLLVALLVICSVRLFRIISGSYDRFPLATVVALLLFAAYAVPFWFFIRSLDYMEPEPPLLLAAAFAWGAAVAITVAIQGNQAVSDLLAKLISPNFAASWGPAISGPTIEELLKLLGVVIIVLIARAQINSVLDGMVYGALVGLGFQVIEDVIYSVNAVSVAGQGDVVGPVITTFFLRGFLAGLWSHTLFSALAGAGVAYFVVYRDRSLWNRLGGTGLAFAAAWTLHFVWNSPLLADGLGGGGSGVLVGLLLKGIPALLLASGLVYLARHREAHYYLDRLIALNDHQVLTPDEAQTMAHSHLRAAARKWGKVRSGPGGMRAVRELQRAQCRLAVGLSQELPEEELLEARNEVLAARRRMLLTGHKEAVPSPRGAFAHGWLFWLGLGGLLLFLIWAAISSLGGA